MAWLAVNKNGSECISDSKPKRCSVHNKWTCKIWFKYWDDSIETSIIMPKGSIEKLIGKVLTWEDEPVEI